jgi:hypothetical protein
MSELLSYDLNCFEAMLRRRMAPRSDKPGRVPVLVSPELCLNFAKTRLSPGAFCDWLTIEQESTDPRRVDPDTGEISSPLVPLNDGCVVVFGADGRQEWSKDKVMRVEGSFGDSLCVQCDGYRWRVSGNLSRWGRTDNVFGLSVGECIERASDFCEAVGLPRFTFSRAASQVESRGLRRATTGARLRRVDLTVNYSTGSLSNAYAATRFFGGFALGHKRPKFDPDWGGVTWGEGSRYWYAKLYVKAGSLGEQCDEKTAAWVNGAGIVRHEVELKGKYLDKKGLDDPFVWFGGSEGQSMENIVYGRFSDVIVRNSVSVTEYSEIPGRAGEIVAAWLNGKDIWGDESRSRATRYRLRAMALAYGVDIREPFDATKLAARVRVIDLVHAEAPAWYWADAA